MAQLQVLTEAGNVLAVSELLDDLLIEGAHNEIKSVDFLINIIASGEAKKFHLTDEITTLEGEVVKGDPPNLADGVFTLSKVDLRKGEFIQGRVTARTVKEEVKQRC